MTRPGSGHYVERPDVFVLQKSNNILTAYSGCSDWVLNFDGKPVWEIANVAEMPIGQNKALVKPPSNWRYHLG